MHFVTGGNLHGKKKWTLAFYQQKGKNSPCIVSAFQEWGMDHSIEEIKNSLLVVEGVEMLIRKELQNSDIAEVQSLFKGWLRRLETWEKTEEERRVVLIGSDITKGIVPMDAELRQWRDCTGLIYQEIANVADRVDCIWYGLNEQLK